MIHEKATDQQYPDWDSKSAWGSFTRFLEYGDDGFPVRHVDMFANGNALRYDRTHWIDKFGVLADAHRRVWGPAEPITELEFAEAWEFAGESVAHAEQVRSNQSARSGAPPWLPRNGN